MACLELARFVILTDRTLGENSDHSKTVLSSIVVEHLKKRFINQNVPVLCMYLNYKESRVQTVENLLGSLLKQLVQYQDESFRSAEVQRVFREAQNEARITINELKRLLRSEIMTFTR